MLHAVCDKIKFKNRGTATKQLKKLRDLSGDFKLYSYVCSQCGRYHIGHLENSNYQQPLKGALRKNRKLKHFRP